jgi:hypothetical protein
VDGYSFTGFLCAILKQFITKIHKLGKILNKKLNCWPTRIKKKIIPVYVKGVKCMFKEIRLSRKRDFEHKEHYFKNEINMFKYFEMTLWKQR